MSDFVYDPCGNRYNLNTHTPAALYEAFAPAEARRITRKLEFHYTPKHGSWLNRAECEFAVLSTQCLDRRIPDGETLKQEIDAWQTKRNQHKKRSTGNSALTWHESNSSDCIPRWNDLEKPSFKQALHS